MHAPHLDTRHPTTAGIRRLSCAAVAAVITMVTGCAAAPPPAAETSPATPTPALYRTIDDDWGADLLPTYQDVAYGPDDANIADVYSPSGGPSRGTIVFVHGGGWFEGDKADADLFPRVLLAETARGYGVVSIDYRLAGDAPYTALVSDIGAAVDWVRANGSALGLDTSTVVLAGFSAGAHLATLTAVLANSPWSPVIGLPTVDGVVALSGAYDMERMTYWTGIPGWLPTTGDRAAASPIRWVDAEDPPMFMAHGSEDFVLSVGQFRDFRDRAAQVGFAPRLTAVEVDHPALAAGCRNHEVSCGVPADQLDHFLDSIADGSHDAAPRTRPT